MVQTAEVRRQIGDQGPRKVVVGSAMYNMWRGEYPGLERRLEELGEFVDEMAAQAQERYPGCGLDIAALPEVGVNGEGRAREIAVPLDGPVLDAMGERARRHGCYVIVPLYLAEEGDRYSNAAVLLDRKGEVVGTYRKVFPVGASRSDELEGGCTPGKEFPVFECDFGRVGIQICFDMSFDTGWEVLRRKGAELVVWTSQWAGPVHSACRALRNRYYVLTSTWHHCVSLFDPTGYAVCQIQEPERVMVEQIDLSYALVGWQPTLEGGKLFDQKYGERAGYRYHDAEARGIFWSNDPDKPIMEMVRELGLILPEEVIERNRVLQLKLRGGPPSTG